MYRLKSNAKLQKKYEKLPRFPYRELRRKKLDLLQKIFDSEKDKIISSDELKSWIKDNPWVQVYSIFMQKKEKKHLNASLHKRAILMYTLAVC